MIAPKTEQSRVLRCALVFGAWTLVSALLATQAWLSGTMRGEPVTWSQASTTWFLWACIWATLSPIALGLASRFPLPSVHWPLALLVHGCAGFTLAAVNLAIFAIFAPFLGSVNAGADWLSTFLRLLGASFFLNVPVYWLVLTVASWLRLARSVRERERRALELEAQLADAQLLALRAQLQPHFLFNALNTISSLMHDDVEKADRVLVLLSQLLRRALQSSSTQEVRLGEEVALLEAYLSIEKCRFDSRLEYFFEVDEQLLQAWVPSLILQPLVENAVRHGLAQRAFIGRILVSAKRREQSLQLCVRDNGAGVGPKVSEGIGWSNTRARLQLLYQDRHSFDMSNQPEGGLLVQLKIPLRVEETA